MKTKGRYGHFIRWIFIIIDFIVLNAAYFATCIIIGDLNTLPFFSKQVWLMLNISFCIVVYALSSLHDKRAVYIDRVLIHLLKYVLLHAVIFLMLVSFIDALPRWRYIFTFYGIFTLSLSLWWIVSRKLLKWYRSKGYNYKKIVIIGSGYAGAGFRLMKHLESEQGYGYHIEGYFDSESLEDLPCYTASIEKVWDWDSWRSACFVGEATSTQQPFKSVYQALFWLDILVADASVFSIALYSNSNRHQVVVARTSVLQARTYWLPWPLVFVL